MKKRYTKFTNVKAWCNGKAYNFPDCFKIEKKQKGYLLSLYTGSTFLMTIDLKDRKEVSRAYKIVMDKLKF